MEMSFLVLEMMGFALFLLPLSDVNCLITNMLKKYRDFDKFQSPTKVMLPPRRALSMPKKRDQTTVVWGYMPVGVQTVSASDSDGSICT